MSNYDKKTELELKKLGAKIRRIRKAKGYSNYEQFAFEHKFARAQYGRYENGSDLRYSSLLRIIAAFDMTIEAFFNEDFDSSLSHIIKVKK